MAQKKKPGLEQQLIELRKIIDKMQDSALGFDENVELFKKGMDIIRECRAHLQDSELLIKRLTSGENGPNEEDFA